MLNDLLYRCGHAGLGLNNPFFHLTKGPWSVTFLGWDEVLGVLKRGSFSKRLIDSLDSIEHRFLKYSKVAHDNHFDSVQN